MSVHTPAPHAPSTRTTRAELVKPHVDSFNYFIRDGLRLSVASLPTQEICLSDDNPEMMEPVATFRIKSASLGKPKHDDDSREPRTFPNECRMTGQSYCAPLAFEIEWQTPGQPAQTFRIGGGDIPIVVMSDKCRLQDLGSDELVSHGEEMAEVGGYFVVGGYERLIRLLQVPRRHMITCIERNAFKKRGKDYTQYGVTIRCVAPDQTSRTVAAHYLKDGRVTLRFNYKKREYLVPIMILLKAFVQTTDREIFESFVTGDEHTSNDRFILDRVDLMLRGNSDLKLGSREQALDYLGSMFRMAMSDYPRRWSNSQIAKQMIEDNIFIHCKTGRQKFNLLVLMIQKLFAVVRGHAKPDNPDALNMQEALLPGFLYTMIAKEQMQVFLNTTRLIAQSLLRNNADKVDFSSDKFLRKILESRVSMIALRIEMFLRTGSLNSPSGLDLQQISGFTIGAERLNYMRYMSHFRSIHRGRFFTEMKTTTPRRLLPESFGFLCPVHTPDGTPCGLLNHLTSSCRIVTWLDDFDWEVLLQVLCGLGMQLLDAPVNTQVAKAGSRIPVTLNGIYVGRVPVEIGGTFVDTLRGMKVQGIADGAVPELLEITAVLPDRTGGSTCFSEIVLSTDSSRFIRPVKHIKYDELEWIGASEQIHMDISMNDEEIRGHTTHVELSPLNMLSALASLTPFSDFNQSPRNMYQCQMAKQTMGTSYHAIDLRPDGKIYRLEYPQQPIVQNDPYRDLGFSDYPLGTNAVVCVIAYTGYDMEDAMIINKSSFERGFKHGSLIKNETVEVIPKKEKRKDREARGNVQPKLTNKSSDRQRVSPFLEDDGLVYPRKHLSNGDPIYCMDSGEPGRRPMPTNHKTSEPCSVKAIRKFGSDFVNGSGSSKRSVSSAKAKAWSLGIQKRYARNPVLGDKFSSRHGQKGTLSQLWPLESMPFTESGMTPDLLINPHAFPSRMTIGMFVESMAGKLGCQTGEVQDGTPFRFKDKPTFDASHIPLAADSGDSPSADSASSSSSSSSSSQKRRKANGDKEQSGTAVQYFGDRLLKHGYHYYGSERMYSGISGEVMETDIYIGVVYYQRLRHMVSDKSQVRALGPIDQLTTQPLKGRKVHGGIRFGEMERDSMLAHGTSYMLQDRLLNCSDHHIAIACSRCGSLLSTSLDPHVLSHGSGRKPDEARVDAANYRCRSCETARYCKAVQVPFVLIYLLNELAAMNVKLSIDITEN